VVAWTEWFSAGVLAVRRLRRDVERAYTVPLPPGKEQLANEANGTNYNTLVGITITSSSRQAACRGNSGRGWRNRDRHDPYRPRHSIPHRETPARPPWHPPAERRGRHHRPGSALAAPARRDRRSSSDWQRGGAGNRGRDD